MVDFLMPRLGADMTEARLVSWKVRPGDEIRRGAVVAEVDTAKGVIDVECFQPGKLAELVAREGETLPVGAVLARIEPLGSVNRAELTQDSGGERSAVPAAVPNSGGEVPVQVPPQAAAQAVPQMAASTGPASDRAAERRKISPRARKLAEARGVSLAGVSGTGPGGAVSGVDIERAITAVESGTAAVPSEATQQSRMREAIAGAMDRANREIPHYYLQTTVEMQQAEDWLQAENARRSLQSRLLPVVLGLKALGLALRELPQLNGFWEKGKFRPGSGIHVGFAIAMRGGGLVTPAIHDVDQLSLDELMDVLRELIPRARMGKLRSSELTDATITLTSLGDLGVDAVWGVIYPPQVALIGMGRPALRPWVSGGAIVPRTVMQLTLAADHRASDGMLGGRLLAAIGRQLQSPGTLSAGTLSPGTL